MKKIKMFVNNSIKIENKKIIYFDPYGIDMEYNDADIVFCTHSHYDHFSKEDIKKIINKNTKLVIVKESKNDAESLVESKNIIVVEPFNTYEIEGIKFQTTPAYNINKNFHPKENKWVGYLVEVNEEKYFIAGDTDNIPELKNISCDIAFIPVGGTYTMNYIEAADLANNINSKVVVPTHYGSVAGEKEDGEKFAKLVKNKKVEILL